MHSFQRLGALAATIAIVPLAVAVEPVDRDSSFTTFTFGIGTGSYAEVARGCEGQVISSESRPLRDIGLGVEHESKNVRVGVRATGVGSEYVAEGPGGTWLVNPHLSHEGRRVGVGLGMMLGQPSSSDGSYGRYGWDASLAHDVLPLSGHLRLGDRQRGTDFLISLGENVPLLSPSGALEMTQGFRISRVVGGRVGVAGPVPFDGLGLAVRAQVQATEALGIEVRGRLGVSQGNGESTIGLGLVYRIRHD